MSAPKSQAEEAGFLDRKGWAKQKQNKKQMFSKLLSL
jgi:hypothetical protein